MGADDRRDLLDEMTPAYALELYAKLGMGRCHRVADGRWSWWSTSSVASPSRVRHGSDLDSVVGSTRALLDVARKWGHPVVFTVIAYDPHLRDLGIWAHKMPGLTALCRGSEAVDLDPRDERRADEPVVEKTGASAVRGTRVVPLLVSASVDTVVLCGATTSGCIRATAIDLMHNRFPTLVPRECVGDRAADPHEANLLDIHAKYADVVSLDEAIAYLHQGD